MLSGLLAILAVLVVGVSLASAAATLDIYGDYADNRVIDEHYSASDLKAALEGAQGDTSYAGFAEAVVGRLRPRHPRPVGRQRAAGHAGVRRHRRLAVLAPARAARRRALATSRRGPSSPLSILAGALVVTGAGSSIYRRARR